MKQVFFKVRVAKGAPAAFGRLCVETHDGLVMKGIKDASRLRAAVC